MKTKTPERLHRLLAPLATIPACQRLNSEADWFPPVDILEDPEEYLFIVDLPGMRPGDIRVVVQRGGLFITGDRPNPPQQNKKCLRVERPQGYFERRFALPDDASRTEIISSFKGGILELRVRKAISPLQTPATAGTPLRLATSSEE